MDHIRPSLASELPVTTPAVSSVVSPGERGAPSLALVLILSLGAHASGAAALTLLPAIQCLTRNVPTHVAVTLSRPAPPAPVPELAPEPVPEPEVAAPAPIVPPTRTERVAAAPEPEVVAEPSPEPPAPVTSAPPSIDDVFGDPPPAPTLLAGSGGGSYAVAAGEGGPPGGRAGGTGTALGAGASTGTSGEGVDDAAARRRARLAYKRELERLLRARTSYPRAALRERLEGRVELALRIGHDGSLLGVRVAESSGYALLDEAALSSARIDRLPAPPEATGLRETDEFVVPVVYVVR